MWYPPGWEPPGWQPEGWNQDSAAPLFVGPIPNISRALSSGAHTVDLSQYFSGAASYSIDPAVPDGWSFDTETGVLTIATEEEGSFGPFAITATNEYGEVPSNEFHVVVAANLLAYVVELDGLLPTAGKTATLKTQSFEVLAATYLQLKVAVRDSAGNAAGLAGCSARLVAGSRDDLVLDLVAQIDGDTLSFESPDTANDDLMGTYRYEAWIKDAADRFVPVAIGYVTFKSTIRSVG